MNGKTVFVYEMKGLNSGGTIFDRIVYPAAQLFNVIADNHFPSSGSGNRMESDRIPLTYMEKGARGEAIYLVFFIPSKLNYYICELWETSERFIPPKCQGVAASSTKNHAGGCNLTRFESDGRC